MGAGVCLSFDDIEYTSQWKAVDDVLTVSHGWKATFFVNGNSFNSERITNINSLIANGNEIGTHSYLHLDWQAYLLTHTPAQYYNAEIVPSITAIYNTFGITPTSFGYPQVSATPHIPLNTYMFSQGFTCIRSSKVEFYSSNPDMTPLNYTYDGVRTIEGHCYSGKSQSVIALGLTGLNEGVGGREDLTRHLEFALKNNVVLLLFCHNIDVTNTVAVKLSTLQFICDYVVANNMKFYKVSELQPSIFGL